MVLKPRDPQISTEGVPSYGLRPFSLPRFAVLELGPRLILLMSGALPRDLGSPPPQEGALEALGMNIGRNIP